MSGSKGHPEIDAGLSSKAFRRLVRLAAPWNGLVVAGLGCGAALAGARFVRASLIQPLIDDVLVPGSRMSGTEAFELLQPRLVDLGSIAALTVVVAPIAFFGRNYLVGKVVANARRELDQRVAETFLRASMCTHQGRSTGDRITRALSDVRLASNGLSIFYRDILTNVIMVGIGLAMLFFTSWQLATVAVAATPLFLGLVAFFGGRIRSGSHRRQATQSELSRRLLSILSGIRVIKAFGGEGPEGAAFARETDRFRRRHLKILWNRVMAKSTADALGQAVGFVVIAVGSVLALQQAWGMSLGSLSAFAAILFATQKPIKALTAGHAEIMERVAGADRLFDLLDRESPDEVRDGVVKMSPLRSQLRFESVDFRHGERAILEDLSFEASRGEVIAIVGRTGAGKSTLIDLLLRFFEPTAGSIRIDGNDARDFDRASYREEFALVGQDPFLFDLSVADNIRYGRPGASDGEIRAAAEAVEGLEFIESLPHGFDTFVGEFGTRLSGGQKQRIALARALVRDASILVLDEATSALDPATERVVRCAVDRRRGDQTIFLVSHRPAMARLADRCLLLDEGRLVASGSHAALLSASPLYRELMEERGERESDLETLPQDDGKAAVITSLRRAGL